MQIGILLANALNSRTDEALFLTIKKSDIYAIKVQVLVRDHWPEVDTCLINLASTECSGRVKMQ